MKKIYLDTNIISSYIRKDVQDIWQMQAIERIISFWKQGFLECYTSEDVKKELEQIPPKYKQQIEKTEEIWMLLEKSQNFVEKIFVGGFGTSTFGATPFGGGVIMIDPTFEKISSIFSGEADQRHIFLAIQNKIEYFVTYDKKTILNKAKQHQTELQKLGIEILSPLDFDKLP